MTLLLHQIMLSENSDIGRFIAFFEQQIAEKVLTDHIAKFNSTKGKVRLVREERNQVQNVLQEKSTKGLEDAILMKHQKKSGLDFFDMLAAKYETEPRKRKARTAEEEKELDSIDPTKSRPQKKVKRNR